MSAVARVVESSAALHHGRRSDAVAGSAAALIWLSQSIAFAAKQESSTPGAPYWFPAARTASSDPTLTSMI